MKPAVPSPRPIYLAALALAAGLLLAALATPIPADPPPAPPATATAPASALAPHTPLKPRNDLPGVANFAQVSPILYRGAQPSAAGFASLKKLGVKTIINLRDDRDDQPLLKGTGLGLKYVRIPCDAASPDEAHVLAFLKVLRDPANQPVFVHCARGADRTGMMVAVYRMTDCAWTRDEALAELPNFHFFPLFIGITRYLQRLDPAALEKHLLAASTPTVARID